MNIFILDKDPEKCAQYLSDIHLNKMIVEHTQMLTNCYSLEELKLAPKTQTGNIRKYSHYNHPASIWTRESEKNFSWLWKYTFCMLKERKFRFKKEHFCKDFIEWIIYNYPDNINISHNDLTPFALAMPDIYKKDCPVESYRSYYINEKQRNKNGKWMMNYTNREYPEWLKDFLKKD